MRTNSRRSSVLKVMYAVWDFTLAPRAGPPGGGDCLEGDNAAMAGLLSLERRDDVAVVTLQRPEKRNALSVELRSS